MPIKRVKLGNDKVTLLDQEDYEELRQINGTWQCTNGYAMICTRKINGRRAYISVHRSVNKTPKHMVTDHINGNKLDNRKVNLRVATKGQNAVNTPKTRNRHGYKGVYKDKTGFYAIAGKKYVGHFSTLSEAARAYNKKITELYGEFARHNAT